MDYEKKYKNALEWARKVMNGETGFIRKEVEEVFPELKESEDERIRKWLIGQLKQGLATAPKDVNPNDAEKAIAWLEKQGESIKLSEEEQNRFAKGVLTRCALSFIDYLDAHKYESKMCVSNGECKDIENAFHNAMWDRLHRYYCKYIEKQGEQKPNYCHHEVDLSGCSEEYRKGYYDGWNNCNQQHAQLKAEQKPACGEEDEIKIKSIVAFLKSPSLCAMDGNKGIIDENIKYLKSLKDKVRPKQEWSEEDEKMRAAVLQLITDSEKENGWNCVYCNDKEIYFSDIIAWFKSLKDRYTWKPSDEQIQCLSGAVAQYYRFGYYDAPVLKELVEQLEKLKD